MPYTNYNFKSKDIERLLEQAVAQAGAAYPELPRNSRHPDEPCRLTSQQVPSLLENLPEYKKLSSKEREELRRKEEVYHLSNLLAGENKAVMLAGQVLVESPQAIPDWIHSISALMFDETKHFWMLARYLKDEIGLCYAPHPKIQGILEALVQETSTEIKMFVSQVVLEWTATSLLASILFKKPEPILGGIIRKILKDEGRHLALNRLVFSPLFMEDCSRLQRRMEDVMFEGIVACISSFFAIPVWREYGFSKASCRDYAAQALEQRGVLKFYSQVLPAELHRCRMKSERLIEFLDKDLKKRIVEDHWSFEPKMMVLNPS